MPYRDQIKYILYNVQANRGGVFTPEDPTPIDPRIVDIRRNSTPTTLLFSQPSSTAYVKSRKRPVAENEEDKATKPLNKRVDVGLTILGLTKEMEKIRKGREESVQIRVVKCL